MTPAEIHLRDYGHTFTCERCRERVNGFHHADPKAALQAIGWRTVGAGKWACSRTCEEWIMFHQAASPIAAVEQVSDRAYQNRRAGR